MYPQYQHCMLCPRNCGINRSRQTGICGCTETVQAARAGLHYYEEPFLSGSRGSGTVFFSGCSLGCIYCQNSQISREGIGFSVSEERLAEIFLEQQERGAHNLNLVTGTHFTPTIAGAISMAKEKGLRIPVVWNSSGYEKASAIALLEGLVDIFLPDFKTMSSSLGQRYMKAPDYPDWAKESLQKMVQMVGDVKWETSEETIPGDQEVFYEGEHVLMQRGVVVRHMVVPGQIEDSKAVLRYLYETYGNQIWISLMSQYTPMGRFCKKDADSEFPELSRTLTADEYEEVVDYAIELGVEQCMIQEGEAASDSFVPAFDGTGILR